jgi:hypothetical protein
MDHEKSLLPIAMDYVEDEMKLIRSKEAYHAASKASNDAWIALARLDNRSNREAYRVASREMDLAWRTQRDSEHASPFARIRRFPMVDRNVPDPLINGPGERRRKNKKKFSWPCPQNNCRGFLDEKFTCGMCDTSVCQRCHQKLKAGQKGVEDDMKLEIKEDGKGNGVVDVEINEANDDGYFDDDADPNSNDDDEKTKEPATKKRKKTKRHRCKKADVETVRFMKRTTRQCPSCPTLIHKISGCSQMWCTQCFTAFDYKTGEIAKGRVHNPHYFQHLREHGNIDRENGDRAYEQRRREQETFDVEGIISDPWSVLLC